GEGFDVIERMAPPQFGSKPGDAGGVSLRWRGSVGKPAELAQSTALVPRERSLTPSTNGQIGVVRRHVLRSAARGGSEHGPYRKSRLNVVQRPKMLPEPQRSMTSQS